MKNSNIKFLIMAIFAIGLTCASCDNKSNNRSQTNQTDKQGKEYTSAYICPMHCKGSGSDDVGNCPVCKMDYVKNDDHKKDGHTH